ncbi:MAG: DUF1499 domain-containing protein [Betaproteobacteria bacterium HGW-Betaproteobacteria-7]|jgi:uncharacterized protein (DUF1499 family)|nr:MAG: DUF1499 domain-containing protein [Betaproteobacteria bacterium HGW-Betaproteobacteria-7]
MKTILYVLLGLLVLILIGARFGLFAGSPPNDLGVTDGRLKPPSATRNSVSSQAALYPGHPQLDYARIAPLELVNGDASASLQTLQATLAAMPELTIIEQRPDYLRVEASTRWLRFVDDLEFWLNPQAGVIEVRSASRLGREDFGINRERMERIRAAYQGQGVK